jgi:hypothetical protein
MATAAEWAKGYARQAQADLQTFYFLQRQSAIPACHKLLFLQMACEKLVKAHRCAGGADPSGLQSSHVWIAKHLPLVLREQTAFPTKAAIARSQLKHFKHLSEEIEVLAPAVKRGGDRPDNCEYPWADSAGTGNLHVPLDWTFHPLQLIGVPAGRSFLKLVQAAIERLA